MSRFSTVSFRSRSIVLPSFRREMVRRVLSLSTLVTFTGAFAAPQYALRAEAPVRPGEITFGIGVTDDEVSASLDTLFPLAVPKNGLLFLNPKLTGGDELDPRVSIGFGYRHLFEGPKIIVGGNVFYDSFDTVHDHRINQFGLGAEVLTRWVDFRANFYLPEQDRRTIAKTQTVDVSRKATSSSQALGPRTTGQSLGFQGNNILQTTTGLNESITTINLRETETTGFWERYEAGMRGGDAEVGVLIPGLDRYADVRIFGGYYFYENDFGKDLNGFKGRLEVRAVPAVTFDAMYYQDEEVIGSNWFYGVRVTAPFDLANLSNGKSPFAGFAESFKPKSRDNEREMFARRLTENVMRTSRVTTSESKFIKVREEKEVYEGKSTYVTSTPFSTTTILTLGGVPITVTHANSAVVGPGNGTYETPYVSLTLADADPVKRNIVLLHADSTFNLQTITLVAGQQLLGDSAGVTHQINSDQGTVTLPRATAGIAPAILSNAGGAIVNVTDNVVVSGLNLNGGARGIYAAAGANNITVTNLTISNMTTAGIEIKPSSGTTINNVTFSGNATDVILNAFNTTITNVTSTGATVGSLDLSNTTGTTTLTNVAISGAGGFGVRFTNPGGTHNITNLDITGGTGTGVEIIGGGGTFGFDVTSSITNTGGAAFTLQGGAANVTYNGSLTQSNGTPLVAVLAGHTGTATFQNGTLSATNGQGLLFDNADGTYNFLGTTTLNGGDAGIDIVNGSDGTFAFGAATAITNPTGQSFFVNGGTANVNFAGSIADNTGAAVEVLNHTTGTINFLAGSIIAATGGSGLQFTNDAGIYNFLGTTTLNGGDAGIDILASNGTFNFGIGTNITNPTGTGFFLVGGQANVTYSGSITDNTGFALQVIGHSVGTLTFNTGTVTSTGGLGVQFVADSGIYNVATVNVSNSGGAGVEVTASPTGTFTFNSLTTSTTAGAGVQLNSAGTVSILGGSINGTGGNGIFSQNTALTATGLTIGDNLALTIAGIGVQVINNDGTARLVTLSNNNIRSTGAGILTTDNGVAGGLTLILDGNTIETLAGGSKAMSITGSGLNSTTVRSMNGGTVIGNGTGGGVLFNRVTFDSDGVTVGNQQVTAGAWNIGQGVGNRVLNDGLHFDAPTGDLAFTTLNIFNNAGTGLFVDTKTLGTTFSLSNTGGVINTTGGAAMFLDPLTTNLTFTSVTSTGSGTTGITLDTLLAGSSLTIGTTSVTGSAGDGIRVETSNGANINFGNTTVTNAGGDGIDLSQAGTANVTFGTTNINGFGAGNAGVNFTGSDVTATFGVTTITNGGNGIGIDLTSSLNNRTITFLTGSNINNVAIGVRLSNGVGTSANSNFTFGDGSAVNGLGSFINAPTTVSALHLNSASGTYNFLDVNFTGSAIFPPPVGGALYFVNGTGSGTGDGSSIANAATIATATIHSAANLGTTNTYVLVNNAGTIDLGAATLTLGANDRLDGFGNGNSFSSGVPINVLGFGAAITDANGAATLTGTGPLVTLANANVAQNLIFSGGTTSFGGTGITDFTFTGNTLTGGSTAAFAFTNAAGTLSINNSTITSGGQLLTLNGGTATVQMTRGTGTSLTGTGLTIQNTTGGSVVVTDAALNTNGNTAVTLNGNAATVTLTNLAITRTGGDTAFNIDATTPSTGAVTIDGTSSINNVAGSAFIIGAGARNITAGTVAITNNNTTAGSVVSVTGQTGGTIALGNVTNSGTTATNVISTSGQTGGTLSFGTVAITGFGNAGTDTAVSLAGTAGTVSFTDLDITTTNGAGLNVGGITFAPGSSPTISATGATALTMNGTTLSGGAATFASVSATNTAGNAGISLTNITGATTLTTIAISNAGAPGIGFDNADTVTINGGSINGTGGGYGAAFINTAFTLNSLSLGATAATLNDGIYVEMSDGIARTSSIDGLTTNLVAGTAVNFNNFGAGVQTFTIANSTLNSTGSLGLRVLINAAGGNVNVAANNNTITQGGLLMDAQGAPGTLTVTSFLNNNVLKASNSGMEFRQVTFDADLGTAGFQQVSGGNTTIGNALATTDVTGFGLRLFNSKGNLGFGTLNIYNDTGTGLYAAPLPGDSLTLSNTAGVVSTTNGAALDITRVALNSTFTSVSSTNAFASGIALDTVSGTAVLGAVNVTNATSSGLLVQGSSANISASSVTIDQTGTNGITLANNTGSFTVTGATNITRAGTDGINLTGLSANPTVTFGATTIGTAALAGFGNANVGINFTGGNVTASFGVTSIQNGGNGTGIDLSSTLGNRTITFAKTSSITNVATGVQLSSSGTVATTANANFTFGDGEGVTDKASTISATTTVAAIGLGAGSGTYNFLDVNFTGTAGFPAAVGSTFVSSTAVNGAGDGSLLNPYSVADADALVAAGTNFAFLDGTYNFATAFTLSASQTLAGLDNGRTFGFGLVQPVNVQGDFGALGGTVSRGSPGSGVGGAISITNTTGTSLFTFTGSTATIEDITVAGSASNTSFFNATGVTGLTLQRVTMGGLPATGSAFSFTNLTAGAVNIQNNALTGNAGSLVSITGGAATYNIVAGTGTLSGRGLSITGTTGGSVQLTGAALATTGNTAVTLNGNAAPITFTNLAITRTAGDTTFNIDATVASTGAITIDGASTLDSTAGAAFLIGAGARNINASALNFTNTGTTVANVISSTGQTGGTISFGNVGITGYNNAAGTAVNLLGTGTVTFADLDITATAGIGLATGGVAFNPGSSATINTLAGAALSMTGTAASGGFTSVSSTGSAGFGIDLSGVTGTLGLGNVTVTGPTTAGLRMTGSSAAVTAGTLTVTTAPTGLVFGTNAGSFTATGATNLTGITGTGINANAATGSYTLAGLTIGFSGAGRGIDLRGSNVTTFTAGTTSITGNGTAGSIAIDLSGSLFPGGQPVSGTPNIQLGTVGAQTATISNVATGVKLGEVGNSAHSFFRYGNQTSGSSIDVIVGGFTIDTTNLTTTTAFQEGRYEFGGVTYGVGDKASFELGSTDYIFVSSAGTGGQSGANPTSAMSIATFLATQNTAVNLANKTVVFVNDGASINLGATTLNAGTNTSLLGFGNGASVTVPGGTVPLNVIGTFTPGGGTFSDLVNGAATVISTTSTLTLSTGNTLSNFILGNATQAVVGTNFGTLTINGMVINSNGRALNLTTGTLAGTGFNSVTTTGGTTGITLIGVGGSMSFGSTTISGTTNQGIFVNQSTASLNFGNTSVTGNGAGTEGVRLENNPNAVLTFGTLTLTNSGGRGFLHTADGGTTNVTGLATITNAASDGILIDGALGLHTVTFANVNSTGSGARGVALTNNTAAVTFADLDISPDAGQTALEATGNTGTITATSGTIVATGAGSAIVITGPGGLTPLNLTLTSVSSAGGTNGISLTNTSGTANLGGGALSGATGATFNVSGGTAVITYNGTVTQNSAANAVNVTGRTGGSVTFGGLVTANTSTATAINLTTNTGSTINFNGGLNIDTTTGTGFNATGGGTINVLATAGDESVTTTAGGTAVNLSGITIGGSGITFDSITANGASANSGLVLNGTGAGTFAVSGITAVDSRTASSIKIDNTVNATFGVTNITNRGGIGIDIDTHAGALAFGATTISGAGGATAAIDNTGSTGGSVTFTSTTISGSTGTAITLTNNAGTFTSNGGTITNSTGNEIVVSGGAGNVTIAAGLTNSTGRSANITGRTGGTVDISGSINDTGTGINVANNTGGTIVFSNATKNLNTGANQAVTLTTNTGATINFTGGGLNIDTTTAIGFGASGGGTINVTGAGNTIDATTGGTALSLSGVTIGGSGFTLASISATGASASSGIVLNGTGAGTLTVTGTTAVDSRSVASIKIDNTVNATFGVTNITNRGGIGIDIDTHAGALAFGATTISGAGGGTAAIDNTGSTGGSVTFTSTTISGSGGAGVSLTNNAGTFTSNGGAIGTSTGNEVTVSGGTGAITIAASLTNTGAGRSVSIDNHETGNVTFSGTISDTGLGLLVQNSNSGTIAFSGTTKTLNTGANTAVTLTSNTGGTIDFTGGNLDIDTTSGGGFSATGGGTVSVQGTNNTITSGTGTALNVVSTTIGASGLTFLSIAANGGTNGIVLNATGAGGLTVTGTGTTDGTGGTIQNTTGRGASFINASNISLNNMNFTSAGTSDLDADNSGLSTGDNLLANAAIHLQNVTTVTLENLNLTTGAEMGINGNTVANFVLRNSAISGFGNSADEDGIHFFNMSGTSEITNTTVSGSFDDHLNLQTQSGTLNLTITGGTFNSSTQGSGLLFGIRGTTNATITMSGVTTSTNFSGGIVADAFDNSTMNLSVTGSTSSGNNDQLSVSAGDNSQVDLVATGNTLSSVAAGDFVVVSLLGSAFDNGFLLKALISNNTITVANNLTADGIIVNNAGGGTINVAITNNIIDYAGSQRAIILQAGQDGNGIVRGNITGNNIDIKLDGTLNAVTGILAQSAVVGPGVTALMDVNIGGAGALANIFTHSLGGTMAGGDIRVRQRNDGLFNLSNFGGPATDTANAITYLNGRNTVVSPSTATVASTGFSGNPTPAFLSLASSSTSSATSSNALLTQTSLNTLGEAAISLWTASGLTEQQTALLQTITFGIADLGNGYLGEASGTTVLLSSTAAGQYWFIDTTPLDHSEFTGSGLTLQAISTGEAAGRVDALSVLLHEIGHVLGLDDAYGSGNGGPLMEGHLELSERLLPMSSSLDFATP